jgi:hypothetical protein
VKQISRQPASPYCYHNLPSTLSSSTRKSSPLSFSAAPAESPSPEYSTLEDFSPAETGQEIPVGAAKQAVNHTVEPGWRLEVQVYTLVGHRTVGNGLAPTVVEPATQLVQVLCSQAIGPQASSVFEERGLEQLQLLEAYFYRVCG